MDLSGLDLGLFESARIGDLEAVRKFLVRNPGNVNRVDEANYSALHYAARSGEVEVVKLLLSYKAEVDFRTPSEQTSLHRACFTGELSVVELLIEAQADVNAIDRDQETPLHKAATNNHAKVVDYLLSHGADKTLRNKHGKTAGDLATDESIKKKL
ncbi:ankyrin repeat domain-containing protein [Anaeramoeba ignava]|uniref:Ankyrin repeat domain-containing protein n=1 Tax=Anaeramoeba ignava TaxID=1746090 RepID=A0A9Q0LC28_ANAIG|nr:ankyrin repeat domain-containing protein [Anaeramoeba ignava]